MSSSTISEASSWVDIDPFTPSSTESSTPFTSQPTTAVQTTESNLKALSGDSTSSSLGINNGSTGAIDMASPEFLTALRRPYTEPMPNTVLTQAMTTLSEKERKARFEALKYRLGMEFDYQVLDLVWKVSLLWIRKQLVVTIIEAAF